MSKDKQRSLEGFEIGQEMAELAANRAGGEWKAIALEAFRLHAKEHRWFKTEDVRAANPDLPVPPDMRAWGHIALLAEKEGYVVAGGYVSARSPTVHGMKVTLWESKIFY